MYICCISEKFPEGHKSVLKEQTIRNAGKNYGEMLSDTRQILKQFYEPHNNALEKLLHKNLSWNLW